MTGTSALVLLATLATSAHVHADTADAKKLFDEGKQLLEAGEIKQACAKFEASLELDARDATEMNLAGCWADLGRTASAHALFVKLAGSAKRDDRATEARKKAKALEAKLVRLTIEVPEEAEVEDLVITRNDQVVDKVAWNQAVPVDPDEYTIVAKAPGREEWSKTFTIKAKDKTVEVPKLVRVRTRKPDKPDKPVETRNKLRGAAIGIAIGGGGAGLIATGLALHSKSLNNQANTRCPNPTCSDLRGLDANRRARQEGMIANVLWGVGGAAVIAAVVVWRVGAKQQAIIPVVTGDQAGLAVGGRF
jgi:hypothetical protein